MSADRKHPADVIFERHPGPAENLERLPPLTDRDLRFVVRAVHEVVGNWEGIALCLKVTTIDKIKKLYRGPEKRMIAVLSAWLRGQTIEGRAPRLTWRSVVWVVADRVGGENPAHAEHILLKHSKFCTPSELAAQVSNSPFVPVGASSIDIRSKAADLQNELGEVGHRWYELGILLGLPVHTLDGFQDSYDEISERLRAMLQEWLKKANTGEYETTSWQVLVNAVEHSAGGGNPRLAGELALKGSPLSDQLDQPIQRKPDLPQHEQLSLVHRTPTPATTKLTPEDVIPPTQPQQITAPSQIQQPTELEMVEEELLTFSANEERTFDHRKGQGFVLHVPKGAIVSSDCTIEVKSYVVGQSTPKFIFPEGSKLVSGVYHITAPRELLKPVSIQIEHCAIIKSDSQHEYAELEVAIADSTTGPPYHFKAYKGGDVRFLDSYIEVELAKFSFVSCLLRLRRLIRAIREPASIHYCGLVCCLRSSELTRTWEYHIVLIRNLQLCIRAIENEYTDAESMQKLSVEFEEGNALTVDNVSVEGTVAPGGWRVATKWDPSRIEKEEADNFEPGRNIPKCCVLASCTTRDTTTVEALRYVLKFSGTRKPKSYLLSRDVQSEQSSRVSFVDGAARHSISTPGVPRKQPRLTEPVYNPQGGRHSAIHEGHSYSTMPSGKHSPEFETLSLHQADLADRLGDCDGIALRLANKLFAMRVIGKPVRDAADVRGPHVTEIMRVNPIIKAILASIDLNPARYQQFREALLHHAVDVNPDIVNAYVPALTAGHAPTQQPPYPQQHTGYPYPPGGSHGNVHPSQYTGAQMQGPSYQGSPSPAPVSKDLMHLQVREWYRLGLALNLDEYDLDIIRKDYQGDTKSQALAMFQLWLTWQPQASYEQLVKALHEVGDKRMVSVLCKKYGIMPPVSAAASSQMYQTGPAAAAYTTGGSQPQPSYQPMGGGAQRYPHNPNPGERASM